MTGREYYIKLAGQGLRMPVGTDLILNEESADPEQARNDGAALGRVIEKSARRWKTPLAVPLMDLRLEKIDLLARIGIGEKEAETFHFDAPLDDAKMAVLCGADAGSRCPGSVARDEALKYIGTLPDLVPVGMAIGPFSLVTRLMGDPITAAAQAGRGISEEDSDDVRLLFQCLKMAEFAVERALRTQIAHGAKAIMVCEPAANTAYLSPRQIRSGADVFERIVMQPNLRMLEIFKSTGCDLIFHNCGELIDEMVEAFAHRLHPVMISLGGSRVLWEDERLIPKDVVMYGNLPTKSFYSDGAMPKAEVIRRTEELLARMKATGHPFVLGSECDVLFVPEARQAILSKVDAMMATTCNCA